MSLFAEQEKLIEDNYIKVVDVLELLYVNASKGWYEVGHFLKHSLIDTIPTYLLSNTIPPEITISEKVFTKDVYSEEYSEQILKWAIVAYIFNNCGELDGDDLENKVLAEAQIINDFNDYMWAKKDLQKLPEFKAFDFDDLKLNKRQPKIKTNIYDNTKKYRELFYVITDFGEKFDVTFRSIANFLQKTQFQAHCDVYVRIGDDEFIKLNKIYSKKAISYVLSFLNNEKFDTSRLELDVDSYHLMHIFIDFEQLHYFEPLENFKVNVQAGEYIYTINYGEVNHRKLNLLQEYQYQERQKIFDRNWEKLKERADEEPLINNQQTEILGQHPSIDSNNEYYAPELALAINVWEAKYIHKEYPHQEHTPAVKNILKNQGITAPRLISRISAITNPKKTK